MTTAPTYKYSIPVNQTTLTQYMVEVTTESGEEYAYYIFIDPGEACYNQPSDIAINWLNQDEAENGSGDSADGGWNVKEYGVFDNPDCPPEDINNFLQRYEGDGVQIVGDRIEVDNLDYSFIPEGSAVDQYDSIDEWSEENGIDLKILG